jgi:proteasome lid subunit RPN8/RPN11
MSTADPDHAVTAGDTFVHVPVNVLDDIEQHALTEAPIECCGLLLGDDHRIIQAVRARNELASRARYRIHPEDHFAAVRKARAQHVDVIGAYHSHPAGLAQPSPTDREEAVGEGFLYLIVALGARSRNREIRAWHLVGGNFRELRLVPIP